MAITDAKTREYIIMLIKTYCSHVQVAKNVPFIISDIRDKSKWNNMLNWKCFRFSVSLCYLLRVWKLCHPSFPFRRYCTRFSKAIVTPQTLFGIWKKIGRKITKEKFRTNNVNQSFLMFLLLLPFFFLPSLTCSASTSSKCSNLSYAPPYATRMSLENICAKKIKEYKQL